jgi:uncharacterized protein (TIGR00730 family)
MRRVCVFTGSSPGHRQDYRAAAADLGRELAGRHIELVYGGANVGLMGAVADAVLQAGGRVTGVIPSALVAKEVAHAGLADLRVVGSMHERKAIMADLADGFIALPGGWGTMDELFEVLTWSQLGLHAKPCGVLNVARYFDPLLVFMDHMIGEGFVRPEYRPTLAVAESAAELLGRMAVYRAPTIAKWVDRPVQR